MTSRQHSGWLYRRATAGQPVITVDTATTVDAVGPRAVIAVDGKAERVPAPGR